MRANVLKTTQDIKSTFVAVQPVQRQDIAAEQEDEDKVFHNLILRERRYELAQTSLRLADPLRPALSGQLRHSLLSWMLCICEHQLCQDEIFPLATMILDNFLLINPIFSIERQDKDLKEMEPKEGFEDEAPFDYDICGNELDFHHSHHLHHHHHHHNHHHLHHQADIEFVACETFDTDDHDALLERELEQRQILLFAACSLLLATKLRQTPRLYIQTLVEFSRPELPVELGREEIIAGELLMLSMLKWDLAALVTPNEFLQELLGRKCHRVLKNFLSDQTLDDGDHDDSATNDLMAVNGATESDSTMTIVQDNRQLKHHLNHQHHQHPQKQLLQQRHSDGSNKCKLVNRVNRHTQTLLELCLMDSQLSQYTPSILAMSSMAVAINGLSKTAKSSCFGLDEIVAQIYESTSKVNELELMIDVAYQIEKYVQTLLHSSNN